MVCYIKFIQNYLPLSRLYIRYFPIKFIEFQMSSKFFKWIPVGISNTVSEVS